MQDTCWLYILCSSFLFFFFNSCSASRNFFSSLSYLWLWLLLEFLHLTDGFYSTHFFSNFFSLVQVIFLVTQSVRGFLASLQANFTPWWTLFSWRFTFFLLLPCSIFACTVRISHSYPFNSSSLSLQSYCSFNC